MRIARTILFSYCLFAFITAVSQPKGKSLSIDFIGNKLSFPCNIAADIKYASPLSAGSIQSFCNRLNSAPSQSLVLGLVDYKNKQQLDDWLYYQLIRKTAQQLSPKDENYYSYTLYKWFLLSRSGYNTLIRISENKMLFYVQSDDPIYNIPYIMAGGKQFICLNYHDYGNNIDFEKEQFKTVEMPVADETRSFSYKVNQLPDFAPVNYIEKNIGFDYHQQQYHFKIKINPEVKAIFKNYPTSEYSNQFSIPLSKETYNSLIPQLKEVISPMNTTTGVDYLMRFTRYAFLFEKDINTFGREKRLSAEETLLYDQSDCEDRAALFFYLVKEIYDLPMIVLSYPEHVTVAVSFDKPVGKPIVYNGASYYVCEPTPQKKDLHIGRSLPHLAKSQYEVVYAYQPSKK